MTLSQHRYKHVCCSFIGIAAAVLLPAYVTSQPHVLRGGVKGDSSSSSSGRRRNLEEQVQEPPYLVLTPIQPDGVPEVIFERTGFEKIEWSLNSDLPLLYQFYGDGALIDSCDECQTYGNELDIDTESSYRLQVTNVHEIAGNLSGK